MSGITFPILRGPLAGKKWLLASRSNFFWGTYEPEQTQAFQRTISPGDVIYDVGAHYGYYTLLSSELSGTKGKVFAFEPSPGNIPRLKKHLAINHCDNVQVIELALSDHDGIARFDNHAGSGTGHLSPDGQIEVQITSLDAISARFPAPNVLKIDCEGAEVEVLMGGEKSIRAAKPAIFLSTHGDELKKTCFNLLESWGYVPTRLHGDDYLWVQKAT
ncbi:MAG TPA: FkbM family methyltransferase [Terriglobales bacterium]|nr:FkbM family methyltransferase [Terriglobales bacterium]